MREESTTPALAAEMQALGCTAVGRTVVFRKGARGGTAAISRLTGVQVQGSGRLGW